MVFYIKTALKNLEFTGNPADNYMLKVNNGNTKTWRRSGVFIVNFEHISHLVLVFVLLTLSRQMPAGKQQRLSSIFSKIADLALPVF